VTIVITVCMRMIRSNPMTPPAMISRATTISATTLVTSPPPQPSRAKTVAVARVARAVSTVSQPTVRIHERTEATRLPRTPSAARLSTMVGAEPRLPARETKPHSRNDTMMPITLAMVAWPKEMPKPSTQEP